MKKGKILSFIVYILFGLALAFFIMFLRYYFSIGVSKEISMIMNLYLVRYRNMALFCLILGFILLIIKSVIDYRKNNIVIENTNTSVLSPISSKNNIEVKTFGLSEDKIVNDLLNGKVLEVKFLDSKLINRKMKFVNYSELNNSMSLLDLEKDKGVLNYDRRYFTECVKCNGIISKDAVKCIHCGEIQKEITKREKKFNPVIFAVNMIIILLSIIVMILLINKIKVQRDINLSNINEGIKTVETK